MTKDGNYPPQIMDLRLQRHRMSIILTTSQDFFWWGHVLHAENLRYVNFYQVLKFSLQIFRNNHSSNNNNSTVDSIGLFQKTTKNTIQKQTWLEKQCWTSVHLWQVSASVSIALLSHCLYLQSSFCKQINNVKNQNYLLYLLIHSYYLLSIIC